MNEELQERFIGALDHVTTWLEGAEGLIIAEAPEVVREIVVLGRVTTTMYLLISLGITFGCVWLFKKALPWAIGDDIEKGVVGVFGTIFPALFFGVAILVSIANLSKFLKAWFAPRLYILDYLAQLIN